ncbi:MAG TPA: TolC family protein [bacterium]|nr:TolC family protein [bacterium]HPR89190.1 TolC family protein [bacterium]
MNKMLCILFIGYGAVCAQEVISLEQAMNLALRRNPELQQARQARRAAAGRFWSGIALPQPELSFSYEYVPRNKSLANFGERTFELAQEIDFPAAYLLRGRLLHAETAAAGMELRHKALALLAEVQCRYWEVKACEAQLAIAQANYELAGEFSRKAAIRQEAGEGSLLERMTAEVQRTQAQNSLETARNDRSAALAQLLLLLGQEGRSGERILSDSMAFTPASLTLEAIEAAAQRQNTELRQAAISVGALRSKRSLSWSSLLPGFRLAWSRQALEGGGNDYYGAAFSASLPLWFMFDQRGRIQEATAELRSGEFAQAAARNALITRLRTAWLELANQERQVQLYQAELLPQAEEICRTAVVSYDAGEIGYLELLQSRQTLSGVKAGYIDALLGYHRAAIELNELTGAVPAGIQLDED